MNEQEFEMELFCPHCKKDTMHKCVTQGHERDSSYDTQECLECHWWACGMDGYKYKEPYDD